MEQRTKAVYQSNIDRIDFNGGGSVNLREQRNILLVRVNSPTLVKAKVSGVVTYKQQGTVTTLYCTRPDSGNDRKTVSLSINLSKLSKQDLQSWPGNHEFFPEAEQKRSGREVRFSDCSTRTTPSGG